MSTNPVLYPSGPDKLKNPAIFGAILVIAIGIGFVIAMGGFTVAAVLLVLPVIILLLNRLIFKPEIGLTIAFILNFSLMGLTRYIPATLGPVMDITLVVIYIAIFFHYFEDKINIRILNNDLVIMSIIWFIYIVVELFNPEAISKAAWFSSMRGIAFYMMMVIPLIYLIYNEPRHLNKFLAIWGIFSILGSVKAFTQLYIGPDPWEQRWLDAGGAVTHVIWGNLRAFSFYTDAGQFGAAQGHIGIVALIIMMNEKEMRKKVFWGIVMAASFYGMSASGTRGAISIPFAGMVLYLILRRNIKSIIIGASILVPVYLFFAFTTIGNSNYQIYRMRTAFTPEDDASYMVRIANQRLFEEYLKNRPFGGGVGHSGARALAYTPDAFLANIATDSWFVLIWADVGIVGLFLHMFIIFYILGKGSYIVMFQIKNRELLAKEAALLCGFFGVIWASYGNAILGQFPTGLMIYSSMAYIFMAPQLDEKFELLEKNKAIKPT